MSYLPEGALARTPVFTRRQQNIARENVMFKNQSLPDDMFNLVVPQNLLRGSTWFISELEVLGIRFC